MTTEKDVEELIQVLVEAEQTVGELIVEKFDPAQRDQLREVEAKISTSIDTLEDLNE